MMRQVQKSSLRLLPLICMLLSLIAHHWLAPAIPPFAKYLEAAKLLANSSTALQLQDYSPGYLLLHRLALGLTDEPANLVLMLQAMVTSLSVGLLTHLVVSLAGSGAALVLGVIAALYAPWLLYSKVLEPEAWILFCHSLFLWLALRLVTHLQRATPLPWQLTVGLAGTLGTAICLRPNAILLALFTVLFMLFYPQYKRGAGAWRRNLKPMALVGAMVMVQVLTVQWILRASHPHGWEVPMSPEQVFHQGNSPQATGALFAYPEIVRLLEEDLKGPDTAHQVYRLILERSALPTTQWTTYAQNFLSDHPRRFFGLIWNKTKLWVNALELHDIVANDKAWRLLNQRFLPDGGWVLPLGLVGMLIALLQKGRRLEMWGALAIIATSWITGALFFVSARHRLAAIPAWIALAAMIWPYVESKKNRLQHFLWLVLALGFTLFVVHYGGEPMQSAMHEQRSAQQFSQAHQRGVGLTQLLNPKKAKANFQEAFASAPRLRYWLALNLLDWDWREAEAASEETVSTIMALARQGAWGEVLEQAALELEEQPGDLTLLTWRALAAMQGDDRAILEEATALLHRYHDPASRDFRLADLAIQSNRPSLGVEAAKRLATTYPEYSIGHRLLCRTSAATNQLKLARSAYAKILQTNINYAYDCAELYPAMRLMPWSREKFDLYFFQGHHEEICAQANGQKGKQLVKVAPLLQLTQSCLFVGAKSTVKWANQLGRQQEGKLQSNLILGIYWFRNHRHALAARYLKKALELHPGNQVATTYLQHLPSAFR